MIVMPVLPGLSLTTSGSLRFICSQAVGLCGTACEAMATSLRRCRRELRQPQTWSAGRKAAGSQPEGWSSCSH
jgi:hypothetical protein